MTISQTLRIKRRWRQRLIFLVAWTGLMLAGPLSLVAEAQKTETTIEFTVAGVPCLGLNGGPAFKHSEAFSFQIATL